MSLDPGAARTALQAGNDAYGRGDYGAAVAAYEQALAAGADSADVLHNLGTALYRAGQMGRAALAGERALRRDPSHELARHNLELVRAQGRDAALVGEEPFFLRLGQRVDPDLAGAGLLGGWYLFAGLLLARRRVAAGIPRLPRGSRSSSPRSGRSRSPPPPASPPGPRTASARAAGRWWSPTRPACASSPRARRRSPSRSTRA